MSRRRGGIVVVLTVGACAIAASAPASRPAPARAATSGCAPAAARILASSTRASAFSLHGAVYGCADTGARRYRLGTVSLCIGTQAAGPVTVAGGLAAYGLLSCGIDTGSGQLIVLRLTDGKQLLATAATTRPLGAESYNRVDAVVLRSDGAVAWIGEGSSIVRDSSDVEVLRATKHGLTMLDSGTKVGTHSLRLDGSKLTWRHGGALRSARLS